MSIWISSPMTVNKGVAWEWGAVWNTLEGDGTEKRGGETKIFKGGGGGCKLGQGVGALKRGTGTSLRTMVC